MSDVELLRYCNLSKEEQTTKLEDLRETILEEDEFRFPRIKLDSTKPRYELPRPIKGDLDNVEIKPTFQGVVLLAKKNFYRSEEDKAKGREAKEKRALYILRLGRYMPDLFYTPPTGVRPWKYFVRDIVRSGQNYFGVLVEFSAEVVVRENTWCKPQFSVVRTLTKEEMRHIEDLREIIDEKVGQWEADADLDKYEDEALAVDRKDGDDRVEEVDDDQTRRHKHAEIEDDGDEAAPAKGRKSSSGRQEAEEEEKPSRSSRSRRADGDEEERLPKSRSSKSKEVEEEEDNLATAKSSGKGRGSYPSLDEEED